jgi:hypothetical protein
MIADRKVTARIWAGLNLRVLLFILTQCAGIFTLFIGELEVNPRIYT